MQWYQCERLFTGECFIDNAHLAVEKGHILSVTRGDASATVPPGTIHLAGLVVPGFIDVQVNGGGGVLFNQLPTLAGLQQMANAHQHFGTTGFLPTVITEQLSVMMQAADAVAQARKQGIHQVLGIHFEGPHLSLHKAGIHPKHKMRPISQDEWQLYTRKDIGVVMVTVAPEMVSPAEIEKLVRQGVRVSLGHSNADADIVATALAAGATGMTHLYNAMSGLSARQPGMIGACFSHPSCYAGIIVDGQHVDARNVNLAYRMLGAERLLLVTDAMAAVGSPQTHFPYEQGVIIRQADKLTLADGTLAGSVLDMASALRNTITMGIPPAAAITMATRTPACWLGCSERGRLTPGAYADWCQLDSDYGVQGVWIKGNSIDVGSKK